MYVGFHLFYHFIIFFLVYCFYRSVRLWDVNQEGQKHKNLMKLRTKQGKRAIPTACTYSRDGIYIAAAGQDGSIQVWDHRRNFVNLYQKRSYQFSCTV